MNTRELALAAANNELIEQIHPYRKYFPDNCRGIILGSAPPARFCKLNKDDQAIIAAPDLDYYYGSSRNLFWDLMFRVFAPEGDLQGLREGKLGEARQYIQKQILDPHGLGIADTLKVFYRKGSSAADQDLYPIEFNSILRDLTSRRPNLEYIFCTGKDIQMWFQQMLIRDDACAIERDSVSYRFNCKSPGKTAEHKTIEVITLPSPSRRAAPSVVLYNAWKARHNRESNLDSLTEFIAQQYRLIFKQRGFQIHS